MKKVMYLLLVLFLVSCASVHPGKYGLVVKEDGTTVKNGKSPTENGLVISGDLDKSFSNEYYKFMVFTFENKTGKITTINSVIPIFDETNLNETIKITSGKELSTWYDAQIAEKKRKEKNRSSLLGAATVTGGLLSAFAGGTWQDIGIGVLAGGALSLTVDELYKDKKNIERGKVFPDSHLMSGEFQIPAGLYERKWILFNPTTEQYPTHIILEYVVDGKKEKILVPVKW